MGLGGLLGLCWGCVWEALDVYSDAGVGIGIGEGGGGDILFRVFVVSCYFSKY